MPYPSNPDFIFMGLEQKTYAKLGFCTDMFPFLFWYYQKSVTAFDIFLCCPIPISLLGLH